MFEIFVLQWVVIVGKLCRNLDDSGVECKHGQGVSCLFNANFRHDSMRWCMDPPIAPCLN